MKERKRDEKKEEGQHAEEGVTEERGTVQVGDESTQDQRKKPETAERREGLLQIEQESPRKQLYV